jgi:hypothetical protein
MDSAALFGLAGALVGGASTAIAAWLAQRGQLRRDAIERARAEEGHWTDDRRKLFREVNIAADEWAFLLRRAAADLQSRPDAAAVVDIDRLTAVERRHHGLVFDVALIATEDAQAAVEAVEKVFRALTNELGLATQYDAGAPLEAARQAGRRWVGGDNPELRAVRIGMRDAMRRELGITS